MSEQVSIKALSSSKSSSNASLLPRIDTSPSQHARSFSSSSSSSSFSRQSFRSSSGALTLNLGSSSPNRTSFAQRRGLKCKPNLSLKLEAVQDNIPTEIIEGLYVGSVHSAYNKEGLQEKRITHVMNVSGLPATFPDFFTYLSVDMRDKEYSNLLCCIPAANLFIESVRGKDKLNNETTTTTTTDNDRGRSNKNGVLVHCVAGRSRSPALVIAYLMKEQQMAFHDAFKLVKRKRKVISLNKGFERQLKAYEEADCDVYTAHQILLRKKLMAVNAAHIRLRKNPASSYNMLVDPRSRTKNSASSSSSSSSLTMYSNAPPRSTTTGNKRTIERNPSVNKSEMNEEAPLAEIAKVDEVMDRRRRDRSGSDQTNFSTKDLYKLSESADGRTSSQHYHTKGTSVSTTGMALSTGLTNNNDSESTDASSVGGQQLSTNNDKYERYSLKRSQSESLIQDVNMTIRKGMSFGEIDDNANEFVIDNTTPMSSPLAEESMGHNEQGKTTVGSDSPLSNGAETMMMEIGTQSGIASGDEMSKDRSEEGERELEMEEVRRLEEDQKLNLTYRQDFSQIGAKELEEKKFEKSIESCTYRKPLELRLTRPHSPSVRIIPPLRALNLEFCCKSCQKSVFVTSNVLQHRPGRGQSRKGFSFSDEIDGEGNSDRERTAKDKRDVKDGNRDSMWEGELEEEQGSKEHNNDVYERSMTLISEKEKGGMEDGKEEEYDCSGMARNEETGYEESLSKRKKEEKSGVPGHSSPILELHPTEANRTEWMNRMKLVSQCSGEKIAKADEKAVQRVASKECALLFLEPMDWMHLTRKLKEEKKTNGELHCPHCQVVIGQWDWYNKITCSCGECVKPPAFCCFKERFFSCERGANKE
eukprot:g2644.t1